MLNQKSNDDGSPGFMDALETLVENLRKECYAKFANRDHVEEMDKKLEELLKNY